MEIKRFNSIRIAPTVGPYSHASIIGEHIYLSGQIALKKDGSMVSGSIEEETMQVLNNIKNILEDLNSNLNNIIKTTIFLTDINDFEKINKVYTTYFKQERPARSCVQVIALPKKARVEIEAIAK